MAPCFRNPDTAQGRLGLSWGGSGEGGVFPSINGTAMRPKGSQEKVSTRGINKFGFPVLFLPHETLRCPACQRSDMACW